MTTKDIKANFGSLFSQQRGVAPDEIRRVFEEAMREWESQRGWDDSNSGNSWTDDELRVVLSDSPTKENCLKHAKAFKRGYGAIEQIYRWAATTQSDIEVKRPDDAFGLHPYDWTDRVRRVWSGTCFLTWLRNRSSNSSGGTYPSAECSRLRL